VSSLMSKNFAPAVFEIVRKLADLRSCERHPCLSRRFFRHSGPFRASGKAPIRVVTVN
jgi:hypothetical protein